MTVYVLWELGNGFFRLYPPVGGVTPFDLAIAPLALASRAGRIRGDECREARDLVAHLVAMLAGGDPLAKQLRSPRPLYVGGGYGFWSFMFCGP